MSYPRIADKVYNSKWAIQPSALASILTVLHSRLGGEVPTLERSALSVQRSAFSTPATAGGIVVKHYAKGSTVAFEDIKVFVIDEEGKEEISLWECRGQKIDAAAFAEMAPASAAQIASMASATAVIFGSGILGKHLSAMDMDCGGLSVDALQDTLRQAAADPAVANIVLWLDTPGGVVTGIPETADLIASIAQQKNVVAYCDSLCASAGYWLASACSAIYCTKSAELGSIGVYSAYMDLTAHYAQKGVRVELFKDGTHKAAGYPGTSLTDEQRADILKGVMEVSAAFKSDVTSRRTGIAADTMQGQCFAGTEAIKTNLADTLVDSLEDVLRDLASLS